MNSNLPSEALGKQAEERALKYLLTQGYTLKEKNYRNKHAEIDLIMLQGRTLVFVEVKYRSSARFGHPEEFVSANQQRSILGGAENYINTINWSENIRFDIIAIDAQLNIEHFEDAFY